MARMSIPSALILQAIANGFAFGFDVMRVTNLASGTVYPALRRLSAEGMISSHWESEKQAHEEGRPSRRYYAVTARGRRLLKERCADDVLVCGTLALVPQKADS